MNFANPFAGGPSAPVQVVVALDGNDADNVFAGNHNVVP